MMNHELVELLKDINAGVDLPERLKQHGIETDSLPPRKRRRLLNQINWAADSFASTLARVELTRSIPPPQWPMMRRLGRCRMRTSRVT